ncbi:MAG: SIS domain-containing protein [Sphingomonadales bacterium]|nr:SIS domain-containing protein [Sphingomonadales bacterium]
MGAASGHTLMFAEAAAAADVVARQLAANQSLAAALARHIRNCRPRLVVTCARGSSDHAATFAKYLIERRFGIPVLSFTPSLASLQGRGLGGSDVLFLAISQSGGSPDIVTATRLARAEGAFTLALVNVLESPLAAAAECVLPLHAGPERSVAATKSFIAAIAALLHLCAEWSGDEADRARLDQLPAALASAWATDVEAFAAPLAGCRNLFVVARGLGLGIAQELALKFKETCRIHAEAFSGAEVRHGPMALVGPGFPVIIIAQPDETHDGLAELARDFAARGAQVLTVGLDAVAGVALPLPPAAPELFPALAIQSLYRLVNAVALAKGLDPDRPPYLAKVTETL